MSVTKIGTGPILLTGATGQVGSELLNTLPELGEVIAPPRSTMDLADPQSIRDTIRALQPRWIVNPGAYTAVDKAESEPELAYAINPTQSAPSAKRPRTIGAGIIHFSTDYVFNGTGTTPYIETDPTDPVSIYGASKLAGEQALAHTGAGHLIFRTSWVYGASGKNFLLTILKLAREREHLRIVGDQHGAPTWSRDLAQMTAHVIGKLESGRQRTKPGHALAKSAASTTPQAAGRPHGTVSPPKPSASSANANPTHPSPKSKPSPPPNTPPQPNAPPTPASTAPNSSNDSTGACRNGASHSGTSSPNFKAAANYRCSPRGTTF